MPVKVELDTKSLKRLIKTLQDISGDKAQKVVARASKRAAIAARTAATKQIRAIYTIKARDMKNRAKITQNGGSSLIHIEGPMESVKKYKAKEKRNKGILVYVKKGNSAVVPRSFAYGEKFRQRETSKRLPIRSLYGPAVPQLFGNEAVIDAMSERGLEMFEKRLLHEFGRLLGGA